MVKFYFVGMLCCIVTHVAELMITGVYAIEKNNVLPYLSRK